MFVRVGSAVTGSTTEWDTDAMTGDQPISTEERQSDCKPLVLIVDDDPLHHRLLQLLADRLNITAHMASSCHQAINALEIFAFDVVLMDIRMPDIDGHLCTEFIRAMNDRAKHVPIIAVTGNGSPKNRQMCMDAGMDDFLTKPFTLEELHAMLCRWVRTKTT